MSNILDDDLLKIPAEPALPLASFWTRVGATLLDSLILMPLIGLGVYNMITWKILPLFILLQIAAMAYKPLLEWQYGQTLGKQAVNIRVVDAQLAPITLQQSLNRYIFYFANSFMGLVAGIMLFGTEDFAAATDFMTVAELQQQATDETVTQFLSLLVFVSCFFAAFDPMTQTLHDKIAKTFVVQE